jgi:lipopolysaccharide transport system ATP-binding protein
MKDDILIDVQNVSKRFCKDLKRSMRYGFMDSLRAIGGQDATATDLRKDEFWAVKDVSFQLRRGECLGLIGHNGAGKSTLLKILNGLINPDQGSITMRGKVGALIELGAGFNPILTGRENIYNNGAVLGFTRSEIDAKVEAIIDFAEIHEFIDTPVQNYSSGMRVRLGFAVAAQMEPDILLIDEVLAVGDVGFTIKCLTRIAELLKTCAVIFVSHSMPQVGKICTSAMMMQHGKSVLHSNNIADVIQAYYSEFDSEVKSVLGNGKAKIENMKFESSIDSKVKVFNPKDSIIIEFDLYINKSVSDYVVFVSFNNMELRPVALFSNVLNNKSNGMDSFIHKHIITKTANLFSHGKYTVVIEVIELNGINHDKFGEYLISFRNELEFISVGSKLSTYCPIQLPSNWEIDS